jgi:hypothetical protein
MFFSCGAFPASPSTQPPRQQLSPKVAGNDYKGKRLLPRSFEIGFQRNLSLSLPIASCIYFAAR